MQGKHREQEQEFQRMLPRRRNQGRGMGATGPPPQKDLGRDRLQGKHRKQEQESQKVLLQRKNQIRGTGATGPPSQKEFEGCRL